MFEDMSDTGSCWTEGANWRFDDADDVALLENINEACLGKRKRYYDVQSRDGRKHIILAKFMRDCKESYTVRKGKKGQADPYFELMCSSNDRHKAPTCSFGAKFRWEEDGSATLVRYCTEHTCNGAHVHVEARCKRTVLLVASNASVRDAVTACRSKSVKDVTAVHAKLHTIPDIPVLPSVHTVKRYMLDSAVGRTDIDDGLDDLSCLEDLVTQLRQHDKEGFFDLQVENKPTQIHDGRIINLSYLRRLTIIPGAAKMMWKSNPFKLASADATHMHTRFGGVCNTIGTIDGERRHFTLMLVLVSVENRDNWLATLEAAKQYLFEGSPSMIVSDRDKGLLAVEDVFPQCVHSNCAVHIARNVGLTSRAGVQAVTGLAKASNSASFHARLRGIEVTYGSKVKQEIEKRVDLFCTHRLLSLYGGKKGSFITNFHVVSNNISESENFGLLEVRRKTFCRAVIAFLERMEAQINERRQTLRADAEAGKVILPSIIRDMANEAESIRRSGFMATLKSWSDSATPFTSWEVGCRSLTPQSEHDSYRVQLFPKASNWQDRIRCTCNNYIASGRPCAHASFVLFQCESMKHQRNAVLTDKIKNESSRALFTHVDCETWFHPGYGVAANVEMYAAAPLLIPSYSDLLQASRDKLLLPYPEIPCAPGSTKQKQHHDNIQRQKHYHTILRNIPEDGLPVEMFHQMRTYKHLQDLCSETHITCSRCGLQGHNIINCKQCYSLNTILTSMTCKWRIPQY